MVTQSIPASQIVQVNPNVLSAGGVALDVIGLLLSTSTRVPIGTVQAFADAADVATYFGSGSTEANAASVYFKGYDGASLTPDSILFAQYPLAAVAGYLRGGSGLTLAQVQAITPATLTITFAGVVKVSSSINLSGASSLSNAATLIQAAFSTPNFAVSYDSVSGSFVFTGSATGVANTIVFPAGAFATALLLTSATGAVLSQGANAAVPGTFMDGILGITQNWVTFMLLFDPDAGVANTLKLAFCNWNNLQDDQFAFVCWDTDITPTQSNNAAASLGKLLIASNISGTCLIYEPSDLNQAAFICGAAASIDFTRTNGRITFAFRQQTGITPGVFSATVASNLKANGYNFYGAYATRNQGFQFFQEGSVSGPFDWFDSYINQIWLNNELQLAILEGLTNNNSIPYNSQGYSLIEAFCLDPINAALNFGAIRPGVTLSAAQIQEVNQAAGVIIAPVLQTRGWYLQIKDASPQVRAARSSPPCTLWYMDGGSIQKITLDSIEVQ